MKPTDFAMYVTAFLTNYLPAQRNASPNTIKAYRDAFVLLLRYCRDVHGLAPERLTLKQIDPPLVLGFLDHLEKDRRCRARTRNLRLTALRTFLELLRSSMGLTVYDSNPAEDLTALAFTKKADAQFQLDFDDALHYATAKKHNFILVSFDQDFDRTDLARKTPSDILSRYENNDSAHHTAAAS